VEPRTSASNPAMVANSATPGPADGCLGCVELELNGKDSCVLRG
jgi:hypothetical protein